MFAIFYSLKTRLFTKAELCALRAHHEQDLSLVRAAFRFSIQIAQPKCYKIRNERYSGGFPDPPLIYNSSNGIPNPFLKSNFDAKFTTQNSLPLRIATELNFHQK